MRGKRKNASAVSYSKTTLGALMARYIVHVDMDAFFASIEQRDNPSYRKKPVIVGADPKMGKGRGVVSASSYEARSFGIHSAMPISIAYKKCPNAVFLPVDMQKYACVSRKIFNILERFTPEIEVVSIDEAFLDITHSKHLFGGTVQTCLKIKELIRSETSLTASIGLAPNKMTAKIASDLKKPDGLVIVEEKDLLKFLHPLAVEKLWGVGQKTKDILKGMGITTIGDVARGDVNNLVSTFGINGRHIWELANGIDPRDVETAENVKSVSNEYTFEEDESDKNEILDTLMALSEKVSGRLRSSSFKGKTITLKIRFSDFKTHTRSGTSQTPTNFTDDIYKTACKKLEEFDLKARKVRLIGVGVSNLCSSLCQNDLFVDQPEKPGKKERLHRAFDSIVERFGEGSLKRRNI